MTDDINTGTTDTSSDKPTTGEKIGNITSSLADLVAHYANAWKGVVDTFNSLEKEKMSSLVGAYVQAEMDCQSAQAKNVSEEDHKSNVDKAKKALMAVFNYLHRIEGEDEEEKEPKKIEDGASSTTLGAPDPAERLIDPPRYPPR